MIYLSGHVRYDMPGIGFMLTPNASRPTPERVWAVDNGRYSAPARYSDARYLAWLAKRDPLRCLFATAPDVVGDHAATLKLSAPMLPRIRALGYRAALVAQNGCAAPPWDAFDCLFIGGDNAFKLGNAAAALAREARQRGKWVHMGRVNSYRRLRCAEILGCNSADGTFLKYAPDINEPRLLAWFQKLEDQPCLDLAGGQQHDR